MFLPKRYYDWFYKYASWVVLPALAMYWIGTYYRINQYGFTEPRVYLVAVGGILTGLVVLFQTKRWGRYLYAACLSVVLLSAVTYIPGITAKDIERISQEGRENEPGHERRYDRYSYMEIDNKYPIDLSGYQLLIPVTGYQNDNCMYTIMYRPSIDSAYTISYMIPSFYLKKKD